jgi:hypothetical protein
MPPDPITLPVLGERLNHALSVLGEVREAQRVQGDRITEHMIATAELPGAVRSLQSWQTWSLRSVVGIVIVGGVCAAANSGFIH